MLRKICVNFIEKLTMTFQTFLISRCLANVRDCEDEEKYICLSCHKRLQETKNNNIVLPYYGRYPNVKAGANFLKSLQEMPEFVCTCCHHILFHKTVKPFKIGEYDMNDIMIIIPVQKCLCKNVCSLLQNDITEVSSW